MGWNFVNELSFTHLQRTGKFMGNYDIDKYTAGSTKEGLHIHSSTLQEISREYVTRRKQFKKAKLRWRVSTGPRKSLGWIPFKTGSVKYNNGQLSYNGNFFSIWENYDLSQYKIRSGSFNQDSRGRWYANLCVETKVVKSAGTKSIGIDLGLKDFATMSDGSKIDAQKFYSNEELKLKVAQRSKNKKRVKAIHAKIANRRKDFHHKLSRKLVNENAAIFIGNVNASKLAKTKMAKSVLNAGWSMFRTMLKYKSDNAAVWFDEVNESYTTQACSSCGSIEGPKGLAGMGIREWTCSCGVSHDRDTNAAKNILNRGLNKMALEISATVEEKSSETVANKDPLGSGVGYDPLVVEIPV